jgi:hypothetical protein
MRIEEFRGTVVDGIARGEAPQGTDPAEVIRHLSAPLYYRMLTGNGAPRKEHAARSADAAMAAIAAGVFVTRR